MSKDIFEFIKIGDENGLRDLLEKDTNICIYGYNAYIYGYNAIGNTPLIEAVLSDNVNMMNILMENGADIHIRDRDLRASPFHYATLSRISHRPMEFLHQKGAHLTSRDGKGKTPFDWALEDEAYDKCEKILEMGANVSIFKRIMFWMNR